MKADILFDLLVSVCLHWCLYIDVNGSLETERNHKHHHYLEYAVRNF